MALNRNQAEVPQKQAGHQFGNTYIYGDANVQLGDNHASHSDLFEHGTEEQRRAALFNALDYAGADARRRQLDLTDIGPSSFLWIKNTKLFEWLRTGTTPFWISGKPGSGKSTLMRHLVDSRSTLDQLSSADNRWTILHFFYDFRAGKELANQPIGMLRLFLQQLMQSQGAVRDYLGDPAICKQLRGGTMNSYMDILAGAIRSIDTSVCAFIDGLDEYDGSLWDLWSELEVLRDRTGMKICLASRPEPELIRAFEGIPKILMQDHNGASINKYIDRKLSQYSSRYPTIETTFSDHIRDLLMQRARGVMLWAKLVIDEMLEEYGPSTTEQSLLSALESFPPELEGLYDRLLDKIPDEIRGDAALVLDLIVNSPLSGDLQLSVLCQAVVFIYSKHGKKSSFGGSLQQDFIALRIMTILGRLLDSDGPADHPTRATVRLTHLTLATHLRRANWLSRQWSQVPEVFHGPHIWAYLSLDVLGAAVDDKPLSAMTVEEQVECLDPTTLNRLALEPFRKQVRSSPKWHLLLDLLFYCIQELPDLLSDHTNVIEEYFGLARAVLSSELMVLHFNVCRTCSGSHYTSIRYYENYNMPILLNIYKHGNMDLASAVIHFLTYYLDRRLSEMAPGSSDTSALLDLAIKYLNQHYLTQWNSMIDCFAGHGFHMNGRHLCIKRSGMSLEMIDCLSYASSQCPPDLWSNAHDERCKHYATSTSLLVHWCEYKNFGESILRRLLALFSKLGEDVKAVCYRQMHPIEVIFDLYDSTYSFSANGLLLKFALLVEHGAYPFSAAAKVDALAHAKALQRRVQLRRYKNLVLRRLFREPSEIDCNGIKYLVDVLKEYRTTGARLPLEEIKSRANEMEFF